MNKHENDFNKLMINKNEIVLISILAVAVFLFLCNFGVIGAVGDMISTLLFGVFGFTAYLFPVMIFLAVAFGISNRGNGAAVLKLSSGVVLFLLFGMVTEFITGNLLNSNGYDIKSIYQISITI